MGRERWAAPGVSPFFTERARSRAPQILSYASIGGAALLASPSGEVVMLSGSVAGLDVDRVAHLATTSAARRSFKVGSACVHVTPITAGWTLCAISIGIEPRIILERLHRASAVHGTRARGRRLAGVTRQRIGSERRPGRSRGAHP